MTSWFGFVALALLVVILAFLWRLVRSPLPLEMQERLEKKEQQKLDLLKEEWSKRLGEEVTRVWQQVQGQVQTTERSVSQKLQQANDTFARVSQELGRLQEATQKVEEVGRNVSSLQDLLRAPKIRGGLGEFFLADLLTQILPPDRFRLQHSFSDGERVDAVIELNDRLLPIDSKFPLERFRKMGQAATDEERTEWRRAFFRDVKQHIDSIAQKYIRPFEGTFDCALMYIPAENVYYESILKDEGEGAGMSVFPYAVQKRVIPVSPNSFYAYLQVILLGLRGMAVEQRTQEILSHLMKLQKELGGLREDFDLAGKQLRNAVSNFERADRHLGRFEDRLGAIEAPQESARILPAEKQEVAE